MVEQVKTIRVADLLGNSRAAITIDDGEALYQRIHRILKVGGPVQLDFDEIDVIMPAFLNAAIGQLLKDITWDDVQARLAFDHLPHYGRDLVTLVLQNAHQHYTDPNHAKAVESVLTSYSENGLPDDRLG